MVTSEKKNSAMKDMAPYMSMGAQLCGSVAVGGGIGWYLDSKFDTQPWLLVIFLFLGIASGMIVFIRTALNADNKK